MGNKLVITFWFHIPGLFINKVVLLLLDIILVLAEKHAFGGLLC